MISYGGEGTDVEDGTLPASAFSWNIDFLHDNHVHPGTAINGVKSGTFTIPTTGHDFAGNTRYRITLTVTDSNGLKDTKSVTVFPQKVNLPFSTAPSGLTLYVDGIARTAPFVLDTWSASTTRSRRGIRARAVRRTPSTPGLTVARAATRSRSRVRPSRTRRPTRRRRLPPG